MALDQLHHHQVKPYALPQRRYAERDDEQGGDPEQPAAPKPAVVAADVAIGKQLAEKSGCLACHAEDKRLVGPANKDFAAKDYTADKIVALVEQSVPADWPDYQPPMPQVPSTEVRQIAACSAPPHG